VVVDIIDHHGIFQNQWKKRRAFYMKENYKIIHTNNAKYSPDVNLTSVWETIYEPGEKSKKCLAKMKKTDDGPFFQGTCFINLKK
jgi:hypothetical protein